LSPEALTKPDSVDARSDLYALGAVGYYLLAGVNVFEAPSVVEVCSHHLHTQPVPPSERLGRPLPRDLEDLLLACLEKDPGRRPQSALAVRERALAAGAAAPWRENDAQAWWARHRSRVQDLHLRTSSPASPDDATISRLTARRADR
jgi:serine/threonine-protein kinase